MGKNFSKNNLGQRNENDFYQTPYSMSRHLLDRMKIVEFPVADPASGGGALVRVLDERYGRENVAFSDLSYGVDFLSTGARYPYIITNPPFSISTPFIKKCKTVASRGFALLMPIEYLHGQERYEDIYSVRDDFPLTTVHIFTRRAMLGAEVREDGKYSTGMITWAWYVWERSRVRRGPSRPALNWIDNNADVLRGRAGV